MSGPETGNTGDTTNTAEAGSYVGAQFGHVHDSNVYVVGSDDPPEVIYEVGCLYLADGVPGMAKKYLDRASARGFNDPRVHFHRALAILSKRSYRDLTKEDRVVLEELSTRTDSAADDPWGQGLHTVFSLLNCVDGSDGDPATATAELRGLPSPQRDLVLRHLALVLTGSMKQGLWQKILAKAKEDRTDRDRVNRVWAYFEPEPAGARAKGPLSKSTNRWDVFGGLLLAGVTLVPLAFVLKSALTEGSMAALVSCLALLVFGTAAAWHIALWNHRHRRMLAALKEHGSRDTLPSPPKGGFTDHVEDRFAHYFAKYAPDPENRRAWLDETAGVRRALRDEVARIYRESKVRNGQVNWLIRFMVRDVRRRWSKGQPIDPHEVHAPDKATKIRCVILCLFSVGAVVATVINAFQQAPIVTAGCLFLAVIAGRFAVPLWLRVYSERRRHLEESLEQEDVLAARQAEYERWTAKLRSLKPTETEMEGWLDADKTLILDETLKYYRLDWHEVAAHAFLPTADHPCKAAREKGGPWRYSKYELRVFLITNEGVRESSTDLDFEGARWERRERYNYRFDALSSVQVEMASENRYTLNITLTNGPPKSIVISEAPAHRASDEEETNEFTTINLDSAGFPHTLRILEGIAAEGKPWFEREADPVPPEEADPSEAA